MRWRQVVGLYVVAGLLGGLYVHLTAPRAERAADVLPHRARVLAISTDAVTGLTIERGAREVVLRREGEGWTVASPPNASLPPDLIRAFVGAVVDAEEIDRVGDGGREPATFGLDDHATRITVRLGDGRQEVLLLGTTNPTGTAVYARRAGAPDVLLVGRTILYYEDLILQALPLPSVPAGTELGPVGSQTPLTAAGGAV
jgi:hypothetical protein